MGKAAGKTKVVYTKYKMSEFSLHLARLHTTFRRKRLFSSRGISVRRLPLAELRR